MSRNDRRIADQLIKQEGFVWRAEVYEDGTGARTSKYVFGYKPGIAKTFEYVQGTARDLSELAEKLGKVTHEHNVTFVNYSRDELTMSTRDHPLSPEEMDSLCILIARQQTTAEERRQGVANQTRAAHFG